MRFLIFGASKENSIGYKLMELINMLDASSEFTLVGRSDKISTSRAVPTNVNYAQCDVSFLKVSGLRARIVDGEFDVVVNCVASHGYMPADDVTYTGMMDHVLEDLHSSLLLAQACHQSKHHIRLVLLSSDAAVKPMTNNLLYNVNKAGLEMMGKQLAHEWRGSNTKIMVIRPPHVRDTEMAKTLYWRVGRSLGISAEAAREKIVSGMPQEVENELLMSVAKLIGTNVHQNALFYHPGQVLFDCSSRNA